MALKFPCFLPNPHRPWAFGGKGVEEVIKQILSSGKPVRAMASPPKAEATPIFRALEINRVIVRILPEKLYVSP